MEYANYPKNELDVSNVSLISFTDIKTNDNDENKQKGVHFILTIIVWTDYITIRKIHS